MNTHSQKPKDQNIKSTTTQQNKTSSTSVTKQLRILDYRNGKYQGFTIQDSFIKDGLGTWQPYIIIGILIDDNYSFLLTEWKQDAIDGPFFMVYPDESIMYGFIEKQKIGEMVCYEVNK